MCDSASGVNVSSGGDAYTYNISPSITIPANSNPFVSMSKASIVWYVHNISANALIHYTDDLGTPEKYTITLPPGLYDTSLINEAIIDGLRTNGHDTDTFAFVVNAATQRLGIAIKEGTPQGYQVKMTDNTLATLVGATDDQKIPAASLSGTSYYKEWYTNNATFGGIKGFNIECPSLVKTTLVDGVQRPVLGYVPITSSPGSLIYYEPFRAMRMSVPDLAGTTLNSIQLRVTDHAGNVVNLAGETWQVHITIEFWEYSGNSKKDM